uniref:Uncharacterized protein n=1 Tax=Salix viminalis TaxID=40686 RepID=A0A6N2LE85_SALVM
MEITNVPIVNNFHIWEAAVLKSLVLWGMDGVKCIDSHVYGDAQNSFPSLEKLRRSSEPHFFGGFRDMELWKIKFSANEWALWLNFSSSLGD